VARRTLGRPLRETFEHTGQVGQDLLAVDWEATPLGPLDSWPQSLQSVVRLVLTSRFAMWMAWGPELTFFCNDAYRRDTLGKKYPWALGKPATEVWSEIWSDIGPRIESVLETGVATWDKSLMLFLERSGYTEETFHTFSYSPIFDDHGDVNGMLCVVSEDTEDFVANRRMQTLRDLGSRRASDLSVAETVSAACAELANSSRDIPFSLVYLFENGGADARLAGTSGFPEDHPAAPAHLVVADDSNLWPAAAALRGETVHEPVLGDLPLPTGAWELPPIETLVIPLASSTQQEPYGFQVFGLNRYRPFDDGYRDFCDLLTSRLAASITDARAYEFEKSRAETLAELDQAKTDFFTNVSHEFRTPLTLLLGPAEDALNDDTLVGEQRERVEVVLRNGQRLLKLVNTLLDFSRLESGGLEARFEPVDLAQYTRELASMFAGAASRLGLDLTVDAPPLPQPVYVDRDLWAKVVLNLLSNALKFTFEGGITVRVVDDGDGACLEFTDTGTGVPEAELPHLFERFHRVSGARSRTHEGSGIGLALVAELMELHGGTVDVRSRLGSGTTFTLRLPYGTDHLPAEQLARPRDQVNGTAEAVAQGFLAEATHWGDDADSDAAPQIPADADGPRVLVVDDNADIREYVAGLLANANYVVTTAVDGLGGLDLARRHVPDLVLTDVMMPRMDGFELLNALHADPRTVDVPVVMLSARVGEEGMLHGLEAGADDYLVKPFTARELLARVRANLELDRARRTRDQLERSRNLLDQAQRLARVGSWELDLETGRTQGSDEFLRMLGITQRDLDASGYEEVVRRLVHPNDREEVLRRIADVGAAGLHFETRVVRPDGEVLLVAVDGEPVLDERGERVGLRGSAQDVTERRAAEEALALAAANAEAAAREHAIADQLQRSLMPRTGSTLEHLEVATYYRAGVEGTQVGGDWYDVIELGGGRTALVVGDVMGRGVRAAAVMGQLRAAVRAYARLDMPPARLLESLDGIVAEMGEDQIVTCIYAVFDPTDRVLRFANAGHLPPIICAPTGESWLVDGAEGPPLGVGGIDVTQHEVELSPDSRVVLYTDGLVERRGEDLELGIKNLAAEVAGLTGPVTGVPEDLVDAMLPEGPDDDVALLIARVDPPPVDGSLSMRLDSAESIVADARHHVASYLRIRGLPDALVDDAALATSELVTNAMLHGQPPVDLHLRLEGGSALIEVSDRASFQPRRMRPGADDEHGRGLQIVAALSSRWGTRATEDGKAVWCLISGPA
jgi:PAS domain S-box-containing protein